MRYFAKGIKGYLNLLKLPLPAGRFFTKKAAKKTSHHLAERWIRPSMRANDIYAFIYGVFI